MTSLSFAFSTLTSLRCEIHAAHNKLFNNKFPVLRSVLMHTWLKFSERFKIHRSNFKIRFFSHGAYKSKEFARWVIISERPSCPRDLNKCPEWRLFSSVHGRRCLKINGTDTLCETTLCPEWRQNGTLYYYYVPKFSPPPFSRSSFRSTESWRVEGQCDSHRRWHASGAICIFRD